MQRYVHGFASATERLQADKTQVIMDVSQSTFAFYLASGAKVTIQRHTCLKST